MSEKHIACGIDKAGDGSGGFWRDVFHGILKEYFMEGKPYPRQIVLGRDDFWDAWKRMDGSVNEGGKDKIEFPTPTGFVEIVPEDIIDGKIAQHYREKQP
jgi:hypothetical protein